MLTQFWFTTSEMELDYCHKKVNIQVASRVAEGLKIQDLRKFGDLKKTPEILGIDGKVLSRSSKSHVLTVLLQNCKKNQV